VAKLVYAAITSLDGYVADETGNFDWAAPDDEVHRFVNDLERDIGTHLYGRRMYDVMRFWETPEAVEGQPPVMREYAEIWRDAVKVVYSSTLNEVSTARTRLQRAFEADDVQRMKDAASRDLSVGGPGLAAAAIEAGLVDEWHRFIAPVVVGGGTRFLPDGVRVDLELIGERRFAGGFVHLNYGTRRRK
jgi:dihydrofolate reductase